MMQSSYLANDIEDMMIDGQASCILCVLCVSHVSNQAEAKWEKQGKGFNGCQHSRPDQSTN